MDTILIAGVETVVGANLAATLAENHRVVGLTAVESVDIDGCRIEHVPGFDRRTVRQWISAEQPARIVYCGAAAQSNWCCDETAIAAQSEADAIRNWALFAAEFDRHLTVISSDALFSGPWVFHSERSQSLCTSAAAQAVRHGEQQARDTCPRTLIVRTNAFGWSPVNQPQRRAGAGAPIRRIGPPLVSGFIERTLATLQQHSSESSSTLDPRPSTINPSFDHTRHATPILATQLAGILESALQHELTGTYHIAGAERVNPLQFANRLAAWFDLPPAASPNRGPLAERPTGFGRGETSLDTRRIRAALGVSMPLLDDGLRQLREQLDTGYPDRLNAAALVHELVA